MKMSIQLFFHVQILTNFLSGVMIHATRPFVVNDVIQTKIEGCEVSGAVEVCLLSCITTALFDYAFKFK